MQPLKIKTALLICTFLSVAPLPIVLFFLFIFFGSESLAYELWKLGMKYTPLATRAACARILVTMCHTLSTC